MKSYTYEVSGTARDGQTWKTNGTMDEMPGSFLLLPNRIAQEVFNRLTQGKAVFGKPGVGCKGPYSFTALIIKEVV